MKGVYSHFPRGAMRIGRDYALDMIQQVGDDAAKNAKLQMASKRRHRSWTSLYQSDLAWRLCSLQHALSRGDITVRETMVRLLEAVERNPLVSPGLREILREVVVEAS